ncbi:MAG: hypothetical protein WCA22_14390 [Candidatus Binatus sp.]
MDSLVVLSDGRLASGGDDGTIKPWPKDATCRRRFEIADCSFDGIAGKEMSAPDIELEAENLPRDFGYVWSDWLYAYRLVRRVGRESTEEYLAAAPVVVSYEDLKDHGLVIAQYHSGATSPTPMERNAAIQWLRQVLNQNENM